MTEAHVPLVDLSRWRMDPVGLAADLDRALQGSGFLLLTGHGVSAELAQEVRTAAARFFALPEQAKRAYETTVGGRGWLAPGREANAFFGLEADPDLADLKESFVAGPVVGVGDPEVDAVWFEPNVWPSEVPELEAATTRYMAAVDGVYLVLLEVCATALGLPLDWFTSRNLAPARTVNLNRYPPLNVTGPAREGQFRIAPHTDWGTLTLLDRQAGQGGLELQSPSGEWQPAPLVPGALTVNVGDLLARWTGDRWRSTRHRVLPPPASAPDEELTSLVAFFEGDPHVVVEPLDGSGAYAPVTVGDYLLSRMRAATVS